MVEWMSEKMGRWFESNKCFCGRAGRNEEVKKGQLGD